MTHIISRESAIKIMSDSKFSLRQKPIHIGGTSDWSDFIQRTFGFEEKVVFRLLGKEKFELAWCNEIKSPISGSKKLVCGVFLDHGSFTAYENTNMLGDPPEISNYQNSVILRSVDLNQKSSRTQRTLHLPDNISIFMDSITSRARNDIRRGLKSRFQCEFKLENLVDFYNLYLTTMKRFGTPPHPLFFFQELINTFDDQIIIGTVKRDGLPISAIFGIRYENVYIHMYSANVLSKNSSGAADLLFFELVKVLIEKNVELIWLGRSIRNSGVDFYKSKWNSEVYSYREYVLRNKMEEIRKNSFEDSQLVSRIVTTAFKKMPNFATRNLGPRVRRLIP